MLKDFFFTKTVPKPQVAKSIKSKTRMMLKNFFVNKNHLKTFL